MRTKCRWAEFLSAELQSCGTLRTGKKRRDKCARRFVTGSEDETTKCRLTDVSCFVCGGWIACGRLADGLSV